MSWLEWWIALSCAAMLALDLLKFRRERREHREHIADLKSRFADVFKKGPTP